MLRILVREGISSVYVEGGAEVNGSFLKESAVNQVIVYLAPKLLGGKLAPTAIGGAGIESISRGVATDNYICRTARGRCEKL